MVTDGSMGSRLKDEVAALLEFEPDTASAWLQWWTDCEDAASPLCRLFFRHLSEESRGARLVAVAIRRAHELGLLARRSDGTYEPSEPERKDGHCAPRRARELFDRLWSHERSNRGRTVFDEPAAELADWDALAGATGLTLVRGATRAELEEWWRRTRRPVPKRRVLWLTPSSDLVERIDDDDFSVNQLRDELGLPHFRAGSVVAMIRWEHRIAHGAHRPTMLEGKWPWFRPAEPSSHWGWTMNLDGGGRGRREAVIRPGDTFPAARLVRSGGRVRTWTVTTSPPPEDELAASLLGDGPT